jgi:restriction endonuclease S subunit
LPSTPSPNFAFLAYHDARLVALGTQAEEHFATDANVTLYKLRQFCEVLAKRAAAKVGLLLDPREDHCRVIDALFEPSAIGATQRDLFHQLRRAGNDAVHRLAGSQSEALHQLKVAHQLAIWFQRSFGNDRKFDPGPFVPPAEPRKADTADHDELARLRAELAAHAKEAAAAKRAADEIRKAAEEEQARRLTAEERAEKAREEAAIWEALAAEQIDAHRAEVAAKSKALEEQNQKLLAELAALQAAAAAAPPAEIQKTVARAAEASDAIQLDEAATRKIIDAQLRAAGWEADSEHLTYEKGARPTKGKSLAIAEWPTHDGKEPGRADYVLFAGLVAVGVVEAKKKHKDVAGVIQQAKRYSIGYLTKADEQLPEGSPWGPSRVPFLFATNGRPYLRQLKDKSGIHFLDARRPSNLSVALESWYTPDGLLALLKQDVDKEHAARLSVRVPPLGEQRRIVAKLEALQARSRRAREALDAVPPLLEKLRQSILAAAFRGDLTKDWRAKNKDVEPASKLLERIRAERRKKWEEAELAKMKAKGKPPTDDRWKAKYKEPEPVDATGLPELPDGWEWTTFETVAEVDLGRQRAPQYQTGRFTRPYLRVANIKDDRIDLTDVLEMDFDEGDFAHYQLRAGDILLSEGQSPELVGQSAIYRGEIEGLCFQKTLHRFRSYASGPPPEFAQLVFRHYVRNGTFRAASSLTVNIAHLTLVRLKPLHFPLPPRGEQIEIVRRAGAALGRVTAVEQKLDALQAQREVFERALFAKAFRGELVPQDPNDEPAEAMLARVRGANGASITNGDRKGAQRRGRHTTAARSRSGQDVTDG